MRLKINPNYFKVYEGYLYTALSLDSLFFRSYMKDLFQHLKIKGVNKEKMLKTLEDEYFPAIVVPDLRCGIHVASVFCQNIDDLCVAVLGSQHHGGVPAASRAVKVCLGVQEETRDSAVAFLASCVQRGQVVVRAKVHRGPFANKYADNFHVVLLRSKE